MFGDIAVIWADVLWPLMNTVDLKVTVIAHPHTGIIIPKGA